MYPDMSAIQAEIGQWPDFHNGVASGLRINRDDLNVTSSWISLNRPSVMTSTFGGFLLGLGLNGHLRQLRMAESFPYLLPKIPLVSIGFLLGLAASHIGSASSDVARQLILHIPALLPISAIDLDHSFLTQAAAMLGLGLLYLGTRHARTAECLLKACQPHPELREWAEAYETSAALAFGCVMIGKSEALEDGKSLTIVSLLQDKNATPALAVAIGMMFFDSGRQDIKSSLELPSTAYALENFKPEILQTRTIGRILVSFREVAPTQEWVDQQIPIEIHRKMRQHKQGLQVSKTIEIIYLSILAGVCFCLGLKFAGSALEDAYSILLEATRVFTRVVKQAPATFEDNIRRSAARNGLNVALVALSSVMASTGDLRILKMLRTAHGQYGSAKGTNYGSHSAVHIALGLLFMGAGRYTLGTKPAAIASMIIAFYPRYVQQWTDNKSYPQVYRHMWALAAEPRCLVTEDIEMQQVVHAPAKIKILEEGTPRSQTLTTPTIVHDISQILEIRIDSPRYWSLAIPLRDRPEMVRALQRLHIKRRTGHLSYAADPKGNQSLFARYGATVELDVINQTQFPSDDIPDLAQSFSADPTYRAFASRMCPRTSQQSDLNLNSGLLMDCLLHDKAEALWLYLDIWHKHKHPTAANAHELMQAYAALSLPSNKTSIIQPAFLASCLPTRIITESTMDVSADLQAYITRGEPSSASLSVWLQTHQAPALPTLIEALELVRTARMQGCRTFGAGTPELDKVEKGIELVLARCIAPELPSRSVHVIVQALMAVSRLP